jgi:hypothetical protein
MDPQCGLAVPRVTHPRHFGEAPDNGQVGPKHVVLTVFIILYNNNNNNNNNNNKGCAD